MRITAVRASWLKAPIPPERAHVSDFGRNDFFNMCLVDLWGSAVLFAAGLHLAIATQCVTILEFSRGHNPLLTDLVEERFELEDGRVVAPDRPGLGVTLCRDVVRRLTVPTG